MTKQEEIDWGLRKIVGELTGEEGTTFLYNASQQIRKFLDKEGVVIRVDKELPKLDKYTLAESNALNLLIGAGLSFTERLIEDGD